MNPNKKQVTLIALLAMSTSAFAAGDLFKESLNSMMFWAFVIAVVFLLIALAALNKSLNTIKFLTTRKIAEESGAPVEEVVEEGPSFMQSLTDAVPVEREADILLDHDYDGIKELDNNLPPWWLWGFYITIVYAVVYIVLFHITGTAPLQDEEFTNEMAQAKVEVDAYLAKMGDLVDENNVTMMTEQSDITAGKEIFMANCVACHLADGGGSIGPNLTDDYWVNGDGSITEVFKTVKYGGRPGKGMLAWKDQLNPKKMQQVSSFVLSLKGTTPAKGKEAEGELYASGAAEEANEEVTEETVE